MIKTKKILICNDKSLYSNERFAAECRELVILSPYNQNITHNIDFPRSKDNRVLFRSSGINYDDYDLLVAQSLINKAAHAVNPISALKIFRDKNWQAEELRILDIKNIPTYSIRDCDSSHLLDSYSEDQSYIIKTQRGLGGRGVYQVKTKQELFTFLNKKKQIGDYRYIVQPYIADKIELRAFIINGELEHIIEKKPYANSFKGNKGSCDNALFETNQSIREQIVAIIQRLLPHRLSYYALDLFLIEDRVTTLEVNLSPGFEILEELTKENIAKKILALLR